MLKLGEAQAEGESMSFPVSQPPFSEKSPRSLLLFDQKLFFTASSDARKLSGAEGLRSHSSQDGVLMRDKPRWKAL